MTKTEQIKIRALQGASVAAMMTEFDVSKQRISKAIHTAPACSTTKRGRKALPLVCNACGVALTAENKAKYHRSCKPCANTHAKQYKEARP